MATEPRSPAIQFYFRQFAGDEQVKAMDLDTVGAHILLICAAGASVHEWKLPANDRWLRACVGHPGHEDWERIKGQLLEGAWKEFTDEDGKKWWGQDGLLRSTQKRKAFLDSQREKGKKGADSRWHSQEIAPAIIRHGPAFASATSSASTNQKKETTPKNTRAEKAPVVSPGEGPLVVVEKDLIQNLKTAFEDRYGKPPVWVKADYEQLRDLSGRPGVVRDEILRRYQVMLESVVPFHLQQAGSLKFFCTHFDTFIESLNGKGNGNGHRRSGTESTEEHLARLKRNHELTTKFGGG